MNFIAQQTRVSAGIPPLAEDAIWRAIPPEDQHHIECEHSNAHGEDAKWITRRGSLCVCDYHRYILDVQRIAESTAFQDERIYA